MNTALQIDQVSQILICGQQALEAVSKLSERVVQLESTIIELRENNGDEGWVTLAAAAKRCGLTQPALRQRIRSHKYPEGEVWKQRDDRGAIFVNIAALRNHL
ncbi:MAG: hypothetical protein HRT38_10540 [Alteromonadaceae bacterium]|nr:hypothetical protein [Alteromonadaceae bacterium]NQY64152.1 hypothetical protein [Alteromonadaceae bacterium]